MRIVSIYELIYGGLRGIVIFCSRKYKAKLWFFVHVCFELNKILNLEFGLAPNVYKLSQNLKKGNLKALEI
jgi:uncharacterized membrane protein